LVFGSVRIKASSDKAGLGKAQIDLTRSAIGMPKVSVIIPAYNAAPYLAESIESVLAQTYKDYEILVVDDGSSDETASVAKKFEPAIKLFCQANSGPASARNLAIKHSTGEYVAFLDSDDFWTPDTLTEQVKYLDGNPQVGLVYGEAIMFTQDGASRQDVGKIGYTTAPTLRKLLFGNFIPTPTVMLRRACIEKVGVLKVSSKLAVAEDYEYWLRIARNFPIAGIARPLAYRRLHQSNLLGDGRDIEKGLLFAQAALREIERQYPEIWEECVVDKPLLFAKLHIRAGFAWKQRGSWVNCLRHYRTAIGYCRAPRVFRWIVAATLLKKWS
jgi:glycosyltransferase involved in cell wall biosynthesis